MNCEGLFRLDRMDISAQLNSKKDKLLSKARTKAGLSQSFETDASEEEVRCVCCLYFLLNNQHRAVLSLLEQERSL